MLPADHPDVGNCARKGPNEEEGFTILEVVVSLALILFIMSALSPLFYTSIRTALYTNARSQATAIATKELESLRVAPYDEVGFFEGQAGYDPNCDPTDPSLETVSLGPGNPASAMYKPSEVVTIPGASTTFTYKKCIAWVDGLSPTGTVLAQAYKKTHITVTWESQGRTNEISQASVVYPGGLGGYSGPKNTGGGSITPTPVAAPATPINVTVTPPADPAGRTQLDVAWQGGGGTVDHYVVEWSTTSGFAAVVGTSGNITAATHSAGGLSAGTTYWFRVKAFGDATATYGSSYTAPVSGTTLTEPPPTSCVVGNLTLVTDSGSTTKTYLKSNGQLNEEVTFSTTFTGPCSTGFHVRGFSPGTPPTELGTTWSFPGSGSSRSVKTNWKNTKFLNQGVTYTFTIYNGSTSTGQSHTLIVCKDTATKSTDPNAC